MIVQFKGTEYNFPDTLGDITLGERIAFYEQYGKALDERAQEISKIEDEFDKEAETNTWHLQMALQTTSFYLDIPLEELTANADIASLVDIYNRYLLPLLEQEKNIIPHSYYEFEGEKWVISAPEVTSSSNMTLNEFIHAKEITRRLHQLGKGKWEVLPYLCAIYLRKEGESFSEAFIDEHNPNNRMLLFQTLPLDIALGVGFFLTSTLSLYTTTLASSGRAALRESTHPSISTGGDGSAS
jgi:hypothetical protein